MALALLLTTNEHEPIASTFPSIKTEKLSGEQVEIPGNFNGSFVLIGIGTSKKAEDALRSWQTPIYNKFIAKTGFMDELYDVQICFLPVFTGISKAAKNKIVKKLRDQNESLVYDNLYIYAGDKKPFETLGVNEKEIPYFFLLDEQGRIVWDGKGQFRQGYLDEIEEILNQ